MTPEELSKRFTDIDEQINNLYYRFMFKTGLGQRITGSLQLKSYTVSELPTVSSANTTGAVSPGTVVDDASVGTVAWNTPGNARTSDNINTSAAALDNNGFYGVADYFVRIVKANGAYGTQNKANLGYPGWPDTETYTSYGNNADLWNETWTVADINNANFGFALSAGGNKDADGARTQSHFLKATNFGFAIPSGATINGIMAEIKRMWVNNGGTLGESDGYVDHMRLTVYYTPVGAPISPGALAFVSNARKNGETAGNGTGVLAFYDGVAWRACDTGATIAA